MPTRGARRAGAAAATLAVSGALAGCGGASAKHGEAAKSPRQIAADVVAASQHLHSFRLGGTITDAGATVRVTGMVAGPGRISFSEQRASDLVQVISLGSVTYMKVRPGPCARWSALPASPVEPAPAPSPRPLARRTSRSATSTGRSR
jgi:hypothetical protein